MTNQRSLRVALGLLGDAMNHGPSEPVFSLIAEARDTIESALRDEPPAGLTYAGACNLLVNYAIALQDRQCCGDEMQPQYLAALKACTDAMGVQPENRPSAHE